MKIDFTAKILGMDSQPIMENGKELTLGTVSCTALLNVSQDEASIAVEEKVRRFKLAQKAVEGGEQDIPVEEAASLKALIGKIYGPLVVGRVFDLIEG